MQIHYSVRTHGQKEWDQKKPYVLSSSKKCSWDMVPRFVSEILAILEQRPYEDILNYFNQNIIYLRENLLDYRRLSSNLIEQKRVLKACVTVTIRKILYILPHLKDEDRESKIWAINWIIEQLEEILLPESGENDLLRIHLSNLKKFIHSDELKEAA